MGTGKRLNSELICIAHGQAVMWGRPGEGKTGGRGANEGE